MGLFFYLPNRKLQENQTHHHKIYHISGINDSSADGFVMVVDAHIFNKLYFISSANERCKHIKSVVKKETNYR